MTMRMKTKKLMIVFLFALLVFQLLTPTLSNPLNSNAEWELVTKELYLTPRDKYIQLLLKRSSTKSEALNIAIVLGEGENWTSLLKGLLKDNKVNLTINGKNCTAKYDREAKLSCENITINSSLIQIAIPADLSILKKDRLALSLEINSTPHGVTVIHILRPKLECSPSFQDGRLLLRIINTGGVDATIRSISLNFEKQEVFILGNGYIVYPNGTKRPVRVEELRNFTVNLDLKPSESFSIQIQVEADGSKFSGKENLTFSLSITDNNGFNLLSKEYKPSFLVSLSEVKEVYQRPVNSTTSCVFISATIMGNSSLKLKNVTFIKVEVKPEGLKGNPEIWILQANGTLQKVDVISPRVNISLPSLLLARFNVTNDKREINVNLFVGGIKKRNVPITLKPPRVNVTISPVFLLFPYIQTVSIEGAERGGKGFATLVKRLSKTGEGGVEEIPITDGKGTISLLREMFWPIFDQVSLNISSVVLVDRWGSPSVYSVQKMSARSVPTGWGTLITIAVMIPLGAYIYVGLRRASQYRVRRETLAPAYEEASHIELG